MFCSCSRTRAQNQPEGGRDAGRERKKGGSAGGRQGGRQSGSTACEHTITHVHTGCVKAVCMCSVTARPSGKAVNAPPERAYTHMHAHTCTHSQPETRTSQRALIKNRPAAVHCHARFYRTSTDDVGLRGGRHKGSCARWHH